MNYKILFFWIIPFFVLSSCIQDEALNAEADIEECLVDPNILKKEPIITNDKVSILVKGDVDVRQQAPSFRLTPGATISPANGTVRDFTTPQIYTVTSEDGFSKKNYEVAYISSGIGSFYRFENVKQYQNRYDIFYEMDNQGQTVMDWASGNAGYSLTGVAASSEQYPTSSLLEGKIGKGLKLVTLSTGDFGGGMGKPMAAGNLFMGEFDLGISIINPLKSLKLGMPFESIPQAIKGYFKYEAGAIYKDVTVVNPDKKDRWDVYAVFFETDKRLKYLDGTNQFTHPNIVSIARIAEKDRIETNQWRTFHMPFVTKEGKSIDPSKLANGQYSLTIVFTSSIDGDTFKGAEGSTLLIDEVELIHGEY